MPLAWLPLSEEVGGRGLEDPCSARRFRRSSGETDSSPCCMALLSLPQLSRCCGDMRLVPSSWCCLGVFACPVAVVVTRVWKLSPRRSSHSPSPSS